MLSIDLFISRGQCWSGAAKNVLDALACEEKL